MPEKRTELVVDAVYESLRKMEVSLKHQDYANHHYYQQVLTRCDGYVSIISRYYAAAKQEGARVEVEKNILEGEIEAKRRNHTVNNEDIQRKYSTGTERERAIDELLKSEINELKKLENRLIVLKNLISVLSTMLGVMRERKKDAKEQWKILCDQSRAANLPDPSDKEVKELNAVLGDLSKEAAEAGLTGELVGDDVASSEDYIEGSEEDDQAAVEALDSKESNDQIEDLDVSEVSVDVDMIDQTENAEGQGSETVETQSESTEESSSSSVESSDIEIILDDDTPADGQPPGDDSTQESPEDNQPGEELSEEDVLDGLDTLDDDILKEIDSVSQESEASESAKAEEAVTVTQTGQNDPRESADNGGNGEPQPVEESPQTNGKDSDAATPEAEKAGPDPGKPVLKEDDATVAGDVEIDELLDGLSEL